MTLPRPALLALLGGVLVVAVFAITRAAGGAGETADPAPVEPPARSGEQVARAAGDEPAAAKQKKADRGVPAALERALKRGQVVVLAFTQDGAADDAAVRDALRSLRDVPVFVADVRDLGDYQELVGSLAIDQAPAVVVVGRKRKARVLEGYVDPGTLAQQVEDAR